MKLLLVSGSDERLNLISHYVKPLGFEIIAYNQILKAMDNIDEIDPQAIIINARDFPRHWKTMVQFVRNERVKEACPIIILTGEGFPIEEASKASFLGVSGVINETLGSSLETDRLQGILGRYTPVDERRKTRRFLTESWQRFGFVTILPAEHILVTGEVKNISSGGTLFLPDNPSSMKDIFITMELPDCSLRAGDALLSPVCRIARTGRFISIEFLSFPDGEQETLNKYLENIPLMELRNSRE